MKFEILQNAEPLSISYERKQNQLELAYSSISSSLEILEWAPPQFRIRSEDQLFKGFYFKSKDFIDVHLPQGNFRIQFANSKKRRKSSHASEGELTAPMPGKVIKIQAREGDRVQPGDLLLILEAMKMEHKIVSPKEGVVRKICFKEGDRVSQGEELVEIQSKQG